MLRKDAGSSGTDRSRSCGAHSSAKFGNSFDSFLQEPADNEDIASLEVDSIGDDTIAKSRKRKRSQHASGVEELAAPLKGRLRLRPEVPVLQKGKKVDRRDVFDGDGEGDYREEADLAAMNLQRHSIEDQKP